MLYNSGPTQDEQGCLSFGAGGAAAEHSVPSCSRKAQDIIGNGPTGLDCLLQRKHDPLKQTNYETQLCV